ncbi:MAG: FecR family protein [bacterium]
MRVLQEPHRNTKWMLGAVLTCLFASQAFALEPIGKVESLTGSATALSSGGGNRTLVITAPVFLNDKITTAADAKLTLRFIDNTTVGQGENAEMVIDTYVFNPADRGANSAAFRLLKGAFRFLTDQITKLNPEQFEVQATYGTIGIRGCDLGFDVSQARDDVFVVGLTGNESILFNLNDDPGGGRPTSLLVREAGIAVTMSPLEGFAQRRFEPSELDNLINLTSTQVEEVDSGADSGGGTSADMESFDVGAPSDGNVEHTFSDAGMAGAGPALAADQVATVVADLRATDTRDEATDTRDEGGTVDGSPADSGDVGEDSASLPDDNPTDTGLDDNSGDGGTVDSDSTTDNNFPITIPGNRTAVASGRGLDWSWDVWARDFTTYFEDGSTLMSTKYSIDSGGDFITADEQLAIATGPNLYHLAGNGDAASIVSYRNEAMLLRGSMSLYVTIGQGVPPTWQSYVNCGNNTAGDYLNFSASGDVGMDGSLETQSINNYQLSAYGFQLGIPPGKPDDMVHGHLVGPGTGPNPITGGLLKWTVDHPNAPSVNGIGGADLH